MNKPIISSSSKTLEYDFKEIKISSVEYSDQYGSGMTLIYSPKYMSFYISKRGKSISGISLDITNGEGLCGTKTICFVGGSTLGLEGVCGVNKALLEENKFKKHEKTLGVCCYTINLNVYKKFIYPDINLGKFAFETLNNNPIPIGQSGAGKNTAVCKIDNDWRNTFVKAGQGAFFVKLKKIKVLVLIILNSIGLVHDNGKLLHRYRRYTNLQDIKNLDKINKELDGLNLPTNTTLTAIITNVKLNSEERKILGEKFHDVVQNMIYPYGTTYDGDVLFLASTKNIKIEDLTELYKLGKECIQKAIYSVFE